MVAESSTVAIHLIATRFGQCNAFIIIALHVLVSSALKSNCRHTTLASLLSHWSSQTVPQRLSMQISTLPSRSEPPPIRRMSPFSHVTNSVNRRTNSVVLPYSTYYTPMMHYPPIPFFGQKLLWRVFTYIVSAHPLYCPCELNL